MGTDLMSNKLSAKEIRFIIGISFILGLRQFGMMLVMPFLSVYGLTLSGNTSALVGLSLGIYALTQGCLQVPYGIISDKIGRKPVVFFGILLQIAGFAAAFQAKSIYFFISARALQGSGAINSVVISWVGDRFDANKGSRALRIISTVSSVAIASSLVGGTILQKLISIPQIFLLCLFLSVLACLYLVFVLKEDGKPASGFTTEALPKNKYPIKNIIINKPLLRLYGTGFISNFMLTGIFFILPHMAENISGGGSGIALILAIPVIFIAMKIVNGYADRGKISLIHIVIFTGFTLSVPCLFIQNLIATSVSSIIFFAGIMCQYYLITAGINQLADERYRATINGVSNTIGFMGSFLGGVVTGVFWGISLTSTMTMLIVVCLSGLIITCTGIRVNNQKDRETNQQKQKEAKTHDIAFNWTGNK
jgi:MFS family permease